jgi:SAM-dependent methyltransferase
MEYNKYIGWKKWDEETFGCVQPGSLFYFDQIFKPRLRKESRVLEIGFGNGELLGYFRAQGHDIVGVEINDELVSRANKFGVVAYVGLVWNIAVLESDKFDLIAAFDVVEHMDHDQLKGFFSWARMHLNDGGRLYLRFPEGGSPFGLVNQNGDFTHASTLTREKIDTLCAMSGMGMLSYADDILSSNRLCSLGLLGKIILLILQGYASALKWGMRIMLFPLATTLKLGTNSVAVITTDSDFRNIE